MKERRQTGCEAPMHVDRCPCLSCTSRDCLRCPLLTRDHFTPKCIAIKLLGWKYKQVNHPANIQYLTEPCHVEKDRHTENIFNQSKRQLEGGTIKFGEHII